MNKCVSSKTLKQLHIRLKYDPSPKFYNPAENQDEPIGFSLFTKKVRTSLISYDILEIQSTWILLDKFNNMWSDRII